MWREESKPVLERHGPRLEGTVRFGVEYTETKRFQIVGPGLPVQMGAEG